MKTRIFAFLAIDYAHIDFSPPSDTLSATKKTTKDDEMDVELFFRSISAAFDQDAVILLKSQKAVM